MCGWFRMASYLCCRLPAAMCFHFLYNLIEVFKAYFNDGKKHFNEDSLRNNFTLVYELLDGSCAFLSRPGLWSFLFCHLTKHTRPGPATQK